MHHPPLKWMLMLPGDHELLREQRNAIGNLVRKAFEQSPRLTLAKHPRYVEPKHFSCHRIRLSKVGVILKLEESIP